MSKRYDFLIIGSGPIGLATAYNLSKNKFSVAIIEKYDFRNQHSSSAGSTRQFRLQYSEKYMAKMAVDSIEYWNDLQSFTDEKLKSEVGSLWFGDMEEISSEGQIKEAIKTMKSLDIKFEELSNTEIEKYYGFSNINNNYKGFFQPNGGTINVNATLKVLYEKCQTSKNVDLYYGENCENVSVHNEVEVITSNYKFLGKRILLATGPFSNDILKKFDLSLDFSIWAMVSMYFKLNSNKNLPSWFIFEKYKEKDPGLYYGFENCSFDNSGYLRVAPAFATKQFSSMNSAGSNPSSRDIELTANWVKKHLKFLDPHPYFKSVCYASIPNDISKKLYLDFVSPEILHFSSGWCFKFVPLIGKICSDLLENGETTYPIENFNIEIKKPDKAFNKITNRRIPF